MRSMENAKEMICVEVAYARPEEQKILSLRVEPGCTAYGAVVKSGIIKLFPQIDLDNTTIGVFGKVVQAKSHQLQDGERVEIYRPLKADPKEMRKARASKAKTGKGIAKTGKGE